MWEKVYVDMTILIHNFDIEWVCVCLSISLIIEASYVILWFNIVWLKGREKDVFKSTNVKKKKKSKSVSCYLIEISNSFSLI